MELHIPQHNATEIYMDNKSAIALAKNPFFHERSSHIDTRYHFIWERIAKKEVQAKFINSKEQVVDIFTKALKNEDFQRLRKMLGVIKSSLREDVEN